MKTLKFVLLSAVALLAIASCKDGYDEAYYAKNATVTSSDAAFTASETGGSVTFTAEAGEVVLNVSCEVGWTAAVEGDWLTASVSTTSGTLVLAAAENTGAERTATVTLSTTESGIGIATIYATQEAFEPEPEPEPEYDEQYYADNASVDCDDEAFTTTDDGGAAVTFASEGGEIILNVSCGIDWTATSDADWLTATVDLAAGTLTLTAAENENYEERTATVTLATAESGITFFIVSATQEAAVEPEPDLVPLILVYTTTAAGTEIILPLDGTVDCTVAWGDGSSETVSSSFPTHTYADAGEYEVTISGTVTALNSDTENTPLDRTVINYLTSVKQWGYTGLTTMENAFKFCQKLASIPADTDKAFSNVTSFNNAFRYNKLSEIPAGLFTYAAEATDFTYVFLQNTSVTEIPEGLFDNCVKAESFAGAFALCKMTTVPKGLFDNCPEVTTFAECFNECTKLKTIPTGLFDYNTKVTDFSYLFSNNTALQAIPAGLFDNCPEVTTFEATFNDCEADEFTEIPEGLFKNNTKVKTFSFCFADCIFLEEIPAGLFDNCPEVTDFSSVFRDCSYGEITSIPKDLFKNNTKVTDFSYAFKYCYYLEDIPEGLFDNCPDVTTFESCFNGALYLEKIPTGLFDKNTKVTNFSYVFSQNYYLEEIPTGLFDYCPDVTDFSYAFFNDYSLESIPTGIFDKQLKVTDFTYTFGLCQGLTCESPYTEIDGTKVHLYDRTSDLGFTAPTSYSGCFHADEDLTDYSSIPSGWKNDPEGYWSIGNTNRKMDKPVVSPDDGLVLHRNYDGTVRNELVAR
ncbi:MAG: BspA family leucine-rich repeat surface protein [Bacteroidales bacterium]|nr:BspA family leucine-rich repeat surface protein [Bacteroidales bacterium]